VTLMNSSRILVVVLVAGFVAFLAWRILTTSDEEPSSEESSPAAAVEPPPLSETPFLNASKDTQFIGAAACASCHAAQEKSYRLTAHSRALSVVDPAKEPADGSFHHEPSGRDYRVRRENGRLHHEETLRNAAGQVIARTDLPMKYLVGSGHFCRTYLTEVDGFLHESPLTWYASTGKWAMSPGYDMPNHWSFERPVRLDCLVCHAGRVEPIGGSDQRLAFHETAIGCESCHGAGSKHRDLHLAGKTPAGQQDFTIVHPGRLSRELLESVCSTCHENGSAAVNVRGRTLHDARPGLPLADFRVHYQLESELEQMTVTGHVQQTRASRCYQRSGTMTCVTCHDPHSSVNPRDNPGHYRQKCLTCHTPQACPSPIEPRKRTTPPDNCVVCHMPKGDTDIPHLAFTHHRIGKHDPARKKGDQGPAAISDLVPLDSHPRLSHADKTRNLGMAYLEAASNGRYSRFSRQFMMRGLGLLEESAKLGLHDAESTFAWAEALWQVGNTRRAVELAREVVDSPELGSDARSRCFALLANVQREEHDLPAAITTLERATKLRRFADDWRMIGVNRLDLGQPREALDAFRKSLEIRPSRASTRLGLAECYRQLGDSPRYRGELEAAEWLQRNRRD
jgi:hypothetical protein